MSLLEVSSLTHGYGDKVLYRDAALALYKGEHMGVVGLNGAGKSTLIGILTGEIVPDQGQVRWQPGVRIGYLDQYAAADGGLTIEEYLKTAFAGLYEKQDQVDALYAEYARTGQEQLISRAAKGQEWLEAQGFYQVDIRVSRVATGLGLDAIGLDRPLDRLSGGQRAKVILAKLLLSGPEVLLLDEPTNFLDAEHVDWLAGYLQGFPNAFVVVSHDWAFLQRVSTCICDVEAGEIRKYQGDYQAFLAQKQFYREDYVRRYQAQQKHIKETEAFIRKNIAGVNTRIAKGRRKQLERLERMAPPAFAAGKPSFAFRQLPLSAQEALTVDGLRIGYDRPLLPAISLSVRTGQKLVITGFNGVGKSTLLNTLMGRLPALGGSFQFAGQPSVCYYEQELAWEDPGLTPMQVIAASAPRLTNKEVRRHLAQCGVNSDHAGQPVGTLSGGEQAKVKLSRLLLRPYHFLILDEPTNHLDADAKEALRRSCADFEGSVILVSHERAFYQDWADRVLDVGELAE